MTERLGLGWDKRSTSFKCKIKVSTKPPWISINITLWYFKKTKLMQKSYDEPSVKNLNEDRSESVAGGPTVDPEAKGKN